MCLTEITCDIFMCVVGVWQRDFFDLWCVCLVRRVAPGTHTIGQKNHAAKHRLRTQKYHK